VWRGKLNAENGAGTDSPDGSANTSVSAAPAAAPEPAPPSPVDSTGPDDTSGNIKP